jgi:hypothetical protein
MTDGLAFHQAVAVYHERNDIAPLQAYLRSLSPENGESLARLFELLHARGQRRRAGNPGGSHLRWQEPLYWVAYLVGERKAAWRREHSKRKVPVEMQKKLVADIIRKVNAWAMMRDKPPLDSNEGSRDFERVMRLLRESKKRRL